MSIRKLSTKSLLPKATASLRTVHSARVLKSGTSNIMPEMSPETTQTVKQLTREWVDPVLNREQLTKQQIIEALGGTI